MSRRNARARVDASGRNPDRVGAEYSYFAFRRQMMHSPHYSALSTNSRALLFELAAMFNGANQDNVFLSVSDAAQRLGLVDLKAASAAFHELAALGFITETVSASFRQKADAKARARGWRLNWLVKGKCAASDVLRPLSSICLAPRQRKRIELRSRVLSRYLKDYQKGKYAVEDSSILAVRRAFSVEVSSLLNDNKVGKPPTSALEESSIHLEYHIPPARRAPCDLHRASHSGWVGLGRHSLIPSACSPRFCDLIAVRRVASTRSATSKTEGQ